MALPIAFVRNAQGIASRSFPETLTAVGDKTQPRLSEKGITVRALGPATAVTLVVEQHPILGQTAVPPADTSPYWGPALAASDAPYSGNPSTGMAPDIYSDAAASWWRVRVTALTGASVEVAVATSGL